MPIYQGSHLPVTVDKIQAGYLKSPYFKDMYVSCTEYTVSYQSSHKKGRNLSRKIYIIRFIAF